MKKNILHLLIFTCLLLGVNQSWGQTLLDSYADSDFTASPVWGGSTSNWAIVGNSDAAAGAISSSTLRLNVSTGAATQYLSTQISTWGTSQEWGFWIGRRSQAFTGSNQMHVWLYANEADLTSATVDGYRIAIGDDSGNDDIRLEYIVNGAVSATVIASAGTITNGLTDIGLLLRVTRSTSGGWEVFSSTIPTVSGTGAIATDIPNSTNAATSTGTGTNNTLAPATNGYFGVLAIHSSGANGRAAVEFDQIYFTASTSPTINISSLNEFTTSALSTPSAEQTLVVSGTSLTNDISITPPTGFEISTVSGGGFTPTNPITITSATANAGNTNVYVRYNPASLANQPQVAGTNITLTSTGASTQNVTVLGSVRNLSQGDFAVIGFNCSTTDAISFVALTSIPANTVIKFTDNGYSDATTQMLTEGYLIYTAPSTIAAGTVVSWNNGMTIGGTGWNSNAPTNFNLNASGEQLFAFQGTWGVSGGTTTLHQGFMSGGTWTTTGTVVSVSANSYLPSGLTTGTSAANFTNANAYYTNNTANTVNTKSIIFTQSSTAGNWTTSNSQITPVPSWPFNIIADEPTTQPSFSAAASVGNNQMTLNFSGGNGTSYMVVMREASAVTATPTDATNYSAVSGTVNFSTATELSAGQKIVYNGTTSGTSVTVTNLSPGTTYHYTIYAYNGTSTTANFFLTSPGTGSQLTTGSANSNVSDIIIHSSFTEPSNIAYHSNQENTDLTDGNSIEVARFTLRDGGATTDADANNTTLNAITFTITNHAVLRRLALYNGTTELGEVAVSSGSASFSGLTLAAADNGSQDFSLRASFAGTVTDNTQFSFAVSSATADVAGSTFAAANAGAAASSTTGDRNRIEVTATLLAFEQQPSNVSINTAMTPAPTVSANDALGNRDLDYTTDMTATTTGTFAGASTNTITPTSGLGTFSNLQFSATASGRTIAVSSGSLTATGNSNTFDITSLIMPGDIAFVSYQTDNPDGFSIINFVDIPASQTFYFTENAWTTSIGPLETNESTITWTTPSSVIPAGTVINFSNSSGSTFTVTPSGNGSALGSTSPGFANAGEQLLMFRGTNSTTPSAFICGVSTTGWITTGTTTSNTSYLPSDLSLNNSAITFSSEEDNGYYNGPQSGSISSIKALVNNGANWLRSSSTQTLPTWSFTINATTTTLTANASVDNLSLESGEKFVIGANTLTVNGAVSGSGTFTGGSSSNLTITGTSGTINFDQTTPGTTNVLKNLTLSGIGTTTLGNALNITGGATPGVITFGSGATAILATGGNLTLASDANGTAVVVGGDNSNITGNVTVQRYLPWTGTNHNGFRFVGHPLRSNPALNTVTNLPTATNTVIGYNNTSNNYTAISDRTTTWPQAIGYGVWTNATNTLAFSGGLQLSDVPAVSMGTDSNRWNYAANPFPSVLDWHGVTKTNIEGTIYRWDKNTDTLSAGSGQAKGKWGTYVQSTQVSANGGSRYMAPMQGFMVQASSGASSASLAYPSSARVDTSATYVRQQQTPDVARASVTHNTSGFGLETVLCFLPQASNTYDPDLEARYVSDGVSASQDLYTKDAQGQTYSIQSLPEMSIHNTTRIPLHLENTQSGATYSWSMDLSGLRSGHQSWLEDTRLGTLTPVVSGQAMTFTAQAGDAVDRFHWVFAAQGTAVPALESAEKVTAHLSDGRLNLRGLRQGSATVQWMDLSGRLLSNQTLNDPDMLQACPEILQEGHYYLLRVQSPQGLYHFRLRR